MNNLNKRLDNIEKEATAAQRMAAKEPFFVDAGGKTEEELQDILDEIRVNNPKAVIIIDDIPKGY